jgi:hypothetical protein
MAVGASLAALLVLLLIAAAFGYDVRAIPHRISGLVKKDAPVYKWVQSDDRTFSFLPGEGKAWGPIDPQQGEVRYSFRSYLPLDIGLMQQDIWENRGDAWDVMKKSSICYEGKTVQASKTCPIANGKAQLIFMRDLRTKQFGLQGISEYAGSKGVKEQNSVMVTIYAWKCVENCK